MRAVYASIPHLFFSTYANLDRGMTSMGAQNYLSWYLYPAERMSAALVCYCVACTGLEALRLQFSNGRNLNISATTGALAERPVQVDVERG